MDGGGSIVIQTSRIKATAVLAANVGFGLIVLIRAKERQDWLLYGFGAFFAVLSAVGLWTLLFRRATLTLDQSGAQFAQGRKRWALAWQDIAQMQFVDTRINGVRTNRVLVLVDRQGKEYGIATSLVITPDQLAALVGERWKPDLLTPR